MADRGDRNTIEFHHFGPLQKEQKGTNKVKFKYKFANSY